MILDIGCIHTQTCAPTLLAAPQVRQRLVADCVVQYTVNGCCMEIEIQNVILLVILLVRLEDTYGANRITYYRITVKHALTPLVGLTVAVAYKSTVKQHDTQPVQNAVTTALVLRLIEVLAGFFVRGKTAILCKPGNRATGHKRLNQQRCYRIHVHRKVQREADTVVAGRIEQCIGVLACRIYLLATPQQRVAVAQCYFLQAVLRQLDLQVQREQTVDTTAVIAGHRIYRITVRAVLLYTLAAPQVRYSRCNLILHTVNRLAVEREVQDIQLFDIFSIAEHTCLANRIAVDLRLVCFEATPQYRITIT